MSGEGQTHQDNPQGGPSKGRPTRQTDPWTTLRLLRWCTADFETQSLPTPRLDAERLLAHVLNCQRIDLYVDYARPWEPKELAAFRQLVQKRRQHVPIAYLTGRAFFRELELDIGPGCLIPRPETEILVAEALAYLNDRQGTSLLEWGCGSGAIALSLIHEGPPQLSVYAFDRSLQALAYARRNRTGHQTSIEAKGSALHLFCTDGLEALGDSFQPQCLVANPPYVRTDDLSTLDPEIRLHEPQNALDGGTDGLDPHRKILAWASQHLPTGGALFIECGANQGEALRNMAVAYPRLAGQISIIPDLNQRPRVLRALVS